LKADEAYRIGEPGHPLRAYLDVDTLVATATRVGADAIYPGYGFLSESADLVRACAQAGLTFVGPPAEVLSLTGDKRRARQTAADAGLPILKGSEPVADDEEALAAAEAIGYPVFVKAVAAGGGGRGLRRVERPDDLASAVQTARREAEGAFGDATVFLEEAMTRPRHIEVQLLADLMHLYERDCSVQRRHQKVVEIAPAPNLDPKLREQLCEDAVTFGRAVGYRNAGTVEFLVDDDGRHVFIEMNPRIQVEHTVTEETTDVDIVSAQLQIAGGASLADIGLSQDQIAVRGTAIQCRVTTENPSNGVRPDTGHITAYRSAAGAGIRLDGGFAYVGAEVSPYFDSLLVKVTARGRNLRAAAVRARRALAEFRIRGVATNVAFLRAVLADDDSLAGRTDTSFIDDRPYLTAASTGADRGSRLLAYLADVTVNSPHGPAPRTADPATKLPAAGRRTGDGQAPAGSRQRLQDVGPDGFARWLRDSEALKVTDTTMRDAHQSLLATRMRTFDMLRVAPVIAERLPELLSLEVWGGATFDVALRFLHENPWDRLARLRAAVPNTCLQMLLRGSNAVGYVGYPPERVRAFVAEAHTAGVDIFRVFDALNSVEQMRPAIEAAREVGAVAEATLCYTGDLADPDESFYTLGYYLDVAKQLVAAGAHILCVKDMAGLLRPPARDCWSPPCATPSSCRSTSTSTSTPTTPQAGSWAPRGGRGIRRRRGGRCGGTVVGHDQPAEPDGHRGRHRPHPPRHRPECAGPRRAGAVLGGGPQPVCPVRVGAAFPDRPGVRTSDPGRLAVEPPPAGHRPGARRPLRGGGGSVRALRRVARRSDQGVPTSKVVGDLALYLASAGIDPDDLAQDPAGHDLPASVIEFLQGGLGVPPNGWPEPFRTKVLRDRAQQLPAPSLSDEQRAALAVPGPARRGACRACCSPSRRPHAMTWRSASATCRWCRRARSCTG